MKIKKILQAIGFVLICQLAGGIGAVFTTSAIPTWYATLNKPSFSPPNWLFGPAWVTLYTLMGIGVFLIWEQIKKNKEAKFGVGLFFVHLLLNAAWSPIFFGLKNLFCALVVIIMIWAMIVWLISVWAKIDKRAAYLLVPYLLWVSFATALNFFIWKLN